MDSRSHAAAPWILDGVTHANERSTDLERILAQADWLRRLARGLVREREEADEVVQDTWVAALAHAPRAEASNVAGLRAWLATVARNVARRRGRDARAHAAHERDAAALRREAHDERELLERARLQRELAAQVVALEEPHRSAIVLRYFDGLSHDELAARLSLTPAAARQRVSRALAVLRERLDRAHGGERRTWSASCLLALGEHARPTPSWPWIPTLMSTKSKLAIAASFLLLALGVWWWSSSIQRDASEVDRGPKFALTGESPSTQAAEASSDRAVIAPEERRTALADPKAEPAGTPPTAIDTDHLLSGLVVDEQDRPLEGARVRAAASLSFDYRTLDMVVARERTYVGESLTAADGTFAFEVPRGRALQVEVERAGFAASTLGGRNAGEHVRVVLRRGGGLAGRVTSGVEHVPVAGAAVRCFLLGNDSPDGARFEVRTTTGADGGYAFDSLPPRNLVVEVDAQGLPSSGWIKVAIAAGSTVQRDVHLEARRHIRGNVVDAVTKAPIAGAEVSGSWTFDEIVRSDASGAFSVPAGDTYFRELHVRARGHGKAEIALAETARATDVDGLVVELAPGWRARGRVLDADGRPLEGAYVAACAYSYRANASDWRGARTGRDGRFALEDLRRDVRYTLFVRASGRGASSYFFPSVAPDVEVLDLEDVRLAPEASIRGTVVDDRGAPIANVGVELRGANADRGRWNDGERAEVSDTYLDVRERRTDDRGRFTFDELAPGEYTLAYSSDQGRFVEGETLHVAAGEEKSGVKLVVARGSSIAGRVVDDEGRPLAQARVSVSSFEGLTEQPERVRTDEDGRFEITGLTGSTYLVEVVFDRPAADARDGTFHVNCNREDVRAGERALEIRAPRGIWLRGRVLDAADAPQPGVLVFAQATSGGGAQLATSRADGSFAIPVARGLEYDVSAHAAQTRVFAPDALAKGVRAVGGGAEIVVRYVSDERR